MLRILIIDDENSIQKLLYRILKGVGFEVDVASNGYEGIEKYNSNYFDLVITDLEMPYLNGSQVAQNIRKSNRPDTPIIGISGTPELLSEQNFNTIITKPFSIRTFLNEIEKVCLTPVFVEVAAKIVRWLFVWIVHQEVCF